MRVARRDSTARYPAGAEIPARELNRTNERLDALTRIVETLDYTTPKRSRRGGGVSVVCVKVKGFAGTAGDYYAYSCVHVNDDWSDRGVPFVVYQPIYPLTSDISMCHGHAEVGDPLWMFSAPVPMPFPDGSNTVMGTAYLAFGGVGGTCPSGG